MAPFRTAATLRLASAPGRPEPFDWHYAVYGAMSMLG